MTSHPWDKTGDLSRKGKKFSGSGVQFESKRRLKIQDGKTQEKCGGIRRLSPDFVIFRVFRGFSP